MSADVCALTGKTGKFIKCHLYPRSFYPNSDADAPLMSYSGQADVRFQRTRLGLYDEQLVIGETEKWFAELDGYAFRALKPYERLSEFVGRATQVVKQKNPKRSLCIFESFDTESLRLFFLSVLWRHAASTRFGKSLDIGPHIDDLRETLICRDLSKGPQFRVVIIKLLDGEMIPVMTPVLLRPNGIRVCQMVFGGFCAYVKCDKRPFPPVGQFLELRSKEAVKIPMQEFRESRTYAIVAQAALDTAKHFGSPWKGKYDI